MLFVVRILAVLAVLQIVFGRQPVQYRLYGKAEGGKVIDFKMQGIPPMYSEEEIKKALADDCEFGNCADWTYLGYGFFNYRGDTQLPERLGLATGCDTALLLVPCKPEPEWLMFTMLTVAQQFSLRYLGCGRFESQFIVLNLVKAEL